VDLWIVSATWILDDSLDRKPFAGFDAGVGAMTQVQHRNEILVALICYAFNFITIRKAIFLIVGPSVALLCRQFTVSAEFQVDEK
jgi:hypothetical protein